ncbi:MAG: radical SAM protein [Ruthenibacterium sp.]
MHVENLMLEITRKCNLKCEHCLRGNAQNKSMSEGVIRSLLTHVDSIGVLTIGGGEPTLGIDVIQKLYQELLWRNVDVQNVFLVTNGKRVSRDLLYWFSQLYSLCSENEISGFAISNDQYHVRERGFVRNKYEYLDEIYAPECDDDGCYIESIDLPEEVIYDHTTEMSLNTNNIFARGRAKGWGGQDKAYLDCLKFDDLENPTAISGEMYVCYNGDVVGDANMSYLDMKKFVRGNTQDWDNLMSGIRQSTIDNYHWCSKNCSGFTRCEEYDAIRKQLPAPLQVG